MLKKLLSDKNFHLLLIDQMAVFLFWGAFYRFQFGADTLFRMHMPMSDIGGALDQQRYASYFTMKWLLDLGINVTDYYRVFFFIFLFSIGICIWLIQRLFLPFFFKQENTDRLTLAGFLAAAALPFLNLLFSEEFMFPEYHLNYACTFLFATLGVWQLARRRYIPGILLVTLGCLYYQIAVIYAAMLITGWLVMEAEYRIDRKLILRVAVCDALLLAVGVLDYVSVGWIKALGLLEQEARSKTIAPKWTEMIGQFIESYFMIFRNSMGLMPSLWIPLMVSLGATLCLMIVFIRKKRYMDLVTFLLLLVTEFLLMAVLPVLSGKTTPRIIFVFYTLQAVLLMSVMALDGKNALKKGFAIACMLYLLVQGFFAQRIIENRYLSNRLDVLYARMVLREIEQYEKENGTEVTQVAIAYDTDAANAYEEVKYAREQINERVMYSSPYLLLEYANGSDLKMTHAAMDQTVYEEHFAGRNWDVFNPREQLRFEGDTLYWCIF